MAAASSSSSSPTAVLRLMADLKAIRTEVPEGCSASPVSDDDLFVWSATVSGPYETPWEGWVFGLGLTFADSYPEKPPRVRFTCEVFHPNGECGGVLGDPLNLLSSGLFAMRSRDHCFDGYGCRSHRLMDATCC